MENISIIKDNNTMSYTITELSFILYNNRSLDMVKHFLPIAEPDVIIEIEQKLEWCKMKDKDREVEIDLSQLDTTAKDIILKPYHLTSLTETIKEKAFQFSKEEKDYLHARGISDDIIKKWGILGLSTITDEEYLIRIGATCHPVLSPVIEDAIEGGGIIIPLFENDKFVNCAIRKLSDVGKLKYTLAVPDMPVWGLHDIEEGDEIWITEGLFDMMALRENGVKCVSVSSPMWSSVQLYQLLCKKPGKINIMVDNDRVGYQVGVDLSRFFNLNQIPTERWHSSFGKDAAEHLFEMGKGFDEIKKIDITKDMIEELPDNSFNFLKHIQSRKF